MSFRDDWPEMADRSEYDGKDLLAPEGVMLVVWCIYPKPKTTDPPFNKYPPDRQSILLTSSR